jgi:hypothetical protein
LFFVFNGRRPIFGTTELARSARFEFNTTKSKMRSVSRGQGIVLNFPSTQIDTAKGSGTDIILNNFNHVAMRR